MISLTYQSNFELHLCFADQGGTEVQAFDIYHRWDVTSARPGVLRDDYCVLRMESKFLSGDWEDEDDPLEPVGFHTRFIEGGKYVKFKHGRNERRVRWSATGSGGNMFWEVIRFKRGVQPHVLNWLRGLKMHGQAMYSPSEWDTEFMDQVWCSRQTLDVRRLLQWQANRIRRELETEAELCKCTVKELLRLSAPQDSRPENSFACPQCGQMTPCEHGPCADCRNMMQKETC